jgi:REP element-mobilizing transposase RayT
MCTYQRQLLFGEIRNNEMHLNELGEVVRTEWQRSAEIRPALTLDECIIMPNHLHAVVIITDRDPSPRQFPTDVGAHSRAPFQRQPTSASSNHGPNAVGAHSRAPFQRPARSLGSFVAGFKSATTKRINLYRNAPAVPVWQRNYYEHVIRTDGDLDRIRDYIRLNPLKWDTDDYNVPLG